METSKYFTQYDLKRKKYEIETDRSQVNDNII